MDIRNCKKCNKLFEYTGSPVCPICTKEMEDKFTEVKNFIRDNPSVHMAEVAEECDVPVQQIKRWVREERLSFTKDSGIKINCEKCGKAILTGRFCRECKDSMSDSLSKLYVTQAPQAEKTNSSAKMRFLQK